jgi:hypothetical protein
MDKDLQSLDTEFSMNLTRFWLFPDMLGNKEAKGFVTDYEIVKTDKAGKDLKSPMLVLKLDLDEPLELEKIKTDKLQLSFWTLAAKGRKEFKPSELVKTFAVKLTQGKNGKIDVCLDETRPYVETIDLS